MNIIKVYRYTLLLVIAVSMLFTSCKKEPVTNPTGTTGGQSNSFSGVLYVLKTSIVNYNIPIQDKITSYYFKSPTLNESDSTFNVGNITIGSIALKDSSVNGQTVYLDTTSSIVGPSYNVSVSGNSTFPAISFVSPSVFPSCGDTNLIPSVINRSSGLQLNLSMLNSVDSVSFRIYDSLDVGVEKRLAVNSGSSTSISFTASDLAALTPCVYGGYILLDVSQFRLINASGKVIKNRFEKMYFKVLVRIN